jgi:hypothetical protein
VLNKGTFMSLHLFIKYTFSLQATGYYDMGFQAPTSLATGREGGLASVAYSMSDGRFTRADNNASPVPSTLSQQVRIHASMLYSVTLKSQLHKHRHQSGIQ